MPSESVCLGHNPTDVQPFHDLFYPSNADESKKQQQQQQRQPSPRFNLKDSSSPFSARAASAQEARAPGSSSRSAGGAGAGTGGGTRTPGTTPGGVGDEDRRSDGSLKNNLLRGRGGISHGHAVAPPKTYYTNEELYELLKPRDGVLPYMYDNFDWPHCDVSFFF